MSTTLFKRFCLTITAASLLVAALALLVAGKSPPKAAPKKARSPFSVAERGQIATLKVMVQQDPALVTATNQIGMTLLHSAAIGNHPEIIEYLIEQGAKIDTRDKLGYTPLHHAVGPRSFETAKLLIERGADPAAWTQSEYAGRVRNRATLIDLAAMTGSAELVELLVKKGVPVEYKETQEFPGLPPVKRSALHWACNGMYRHSQVDGKNAGNRQVIAILVKKIGDINIRNFQLQTPLQVAAEGGADKTVEYILDTYPKADINAEDGDRNTALHLAIVKSGMKAIAKRHANIVRILLKHGARTDVKNNAGQTALQRAHQQGDAEVIKAFSAKPAKSSRSGVTG